MLVNSCACYQLLTILLCRKLNEVLENKSVIFQQRPVRLQAAPTEYKGNRGYRINKLIFIQFAVQKTSLTFQPNLRVFSKNSSTIPIFLENPERLRLPIVFPKDCFTAFYSICYNGHQFSESDLLRTVTNSQFTTLFTIKGDYDG